jgi:hypothetical protein
MPLTRRFSIDVVAELRAKINGWRGTLVSAPPPARA